MQAIVHIGMPKAGSTALQTALRGSEAYLASRSLIYPPGGLYNNHRLLTVPTGPFAELPHNVKGNHDEAAVAAAFDGFVELVAGLVAAQKPAAVIFSSESLYRRLPKGRREAILAPYRRLGAEPLIVAYLRRPSEHYASGLQQNLKGSHQVRPPAPPKYRHVIESYAEVFGPAALSLNLFYRPALAEGDIVADFAAKYLAAYGVEAAALTAPARTNDTISAESVDICRRFGLAFHRDSATRWISNTKRLVTALRKADASIGAGRPRLRPGIAELVDYASADPLWLRDQHGIAFPDYDYRRLETGRLAEAPAEAPPLEGILEIDRETQRAILARLRRMSWTAKAPERQAWIDGLLGELA